MTTAVVTPEVAEGRRGRRAETGKAAPPCLIGRVRGVQRSNPYTYSAERYTYSYTVGARPRRGARDTVYVYAYAYEYEYEYGAEGVEQAGSQRGPRR